MMVKNDSWKKYFVFSTASDGRVNGYCTICQKNYKDNKGVFSNFLKHLTRKHEKEYKKSINDDDDDVFEENVDVLTNLSTTNSSPNKMKQNRINMAIAKNLIVKCNLPLSIVENSAFRDFINECNIKWQPISSKRLKLEYISFFKEKVNKALRDALNNVNYVTLTVDGWTDRKCRSFIGVTCHFIDSKSEPQAYLIDFVRIKSPHTAEKIHQITEEILDRYDLKDKVYKIVTDNASTMIKAYKFGLAVDEEAETGDGIAELKSNSTSDDVDGTYSIYNTMSAN